MQRIQQNALSIPVGPQGEFSVGLGGSHDHCAAGTSCADKKCWCRCVSADRRNPVPKPAATCKRRCTQTARYPSDFFFCLVLFRRCLSYAACYTATQGDDSHHFFNWFHTPPLSFLCLSM